MADVKSAAQWIGKLLAEEVQYLSKVGDKVRELQDELEWMQCFLRDADASQIDNSMARKWVAQIREFAYEAEDTAEKFLVSSSGNGRGLISKIKNYTKMFWNVIALHKMGNRVDALKEKMSFLTKKLRTYGIQFNLGDSLSSLTLKGDHDTYFKFKKDKLIGREDVVNQLIYRLLVLREIEVTSTESSSSNTGQLVMSREADRESRVISICGVGGIGKTFVANEVFQHPEIRRNYQAFAWASISHPCQISAVLQELLSCLTSKSRVQIAQMTDSELQRELRNVQLRKKCLIVLDGLWKAELWDDLKGAFPITCREFKGKILLTTREKDVALHVDPKALIHKLDSLDDTQSKSLLEEKFRFNLPDISADEMAKINDLKGKMLKQCRGLLLAIVVLGGVLATKRTKEDWKKLGKNFSSYSVDNKDESWKRILDLSYYELPYQLKPCFLYLSYFPTNLEITTTKLSRLWEAEGLVSSGDNDESDETLEDVAESYLAELVERSLVQVSSRDLTGRAKTCRLHDVMEKLCSDKALRENWLSVVRYGHQTDEPSGSSSSSLKSSKSAINRKSRRLAIYCTEKLDRLPSDYRRASYVRSLLFFNTLEKDDVLIPVKKMALKSIFHRYELLRVLDIENIGLSRLPKDVGSLIHLRYLSLRGSWVSILPDSIKYLRCLQTLDLRVLSFVCLLIPNVLWRLERLVHLYLPAKPFRFRNKAQKLRLKNLGSLETLSNFSKMCDANDVAALTNLREFSSCDHLSTHESIFPLLGLPTSSLIHLNYISLRLDGQYLTVYPNALASCDALHKLWVKGNISESINSGFLPQKLNKLSLSGSGFLQDPMPILEKLPELKELNLEHASYKGKIMSFTKEGFKELNYLYVEGLENLENWIVEEGAMPKLISLEINRCHKLEIIPEGLRFVKSLKELMIVYMPLTSFGKWTPAQSLEEWDQYWKVKHVHRVDISKALDMQKTNPNS